MLFINRFGKTYNDKPNRIEVVELELNDLSTILAEFDNLPRSKFETYDPNSDYVKLYVKQLKAAIISTKEGTIVKDETIRFILRRAGIDSTPKSSFNKFKSILTKSNSTTKPIIKPKSDNQLSIW